ncbi:MAG: hypothetical protein NZ522_01410, partial [Chitinophagales bacterium]|nr:hypothetical protein [Chitinophagales bacterium]
MIRHYISALIILLIIACKRTTPEQLLSGNWHFFTIEYEEKVSPELQPVVDSQIAQLRQNFYIEYLKDFT